MITFSANGAGESGLLQAKKNPQKNKLTKKNFDESFISYAKIKLKWIIDLNMKPKL